MTSTKHSGHEVNQCIKEIRGQIVEQVRALESRSEVENAILCDISDFLKKRAEIEAEYSSKLDKLAKSAMLKHKNEKTKRQNWPMFTICSLWQQLVDHTKEEARQRAVTVDVFGTQIPQAIASRVALNAKVTKKVKEIVVSEHGDVHRVLEELCKSMSNYHKLFAAANSAKHKLQAAEAEKQKNEKSTKKQKALNKQLEKFEAARAQCNRSRNEYLLCIEAANAALYQYYANDLSDFIDCTNVGYEFWVNMVLTNIIAARKAVCQQEMNSLANLSSFRESFDTDFDKHRFFESNSSIFQLPKPFEFKRDAGEQIGHIITASPLGEELELRRNQIKKRLEVITKESEQCLVDLEQQTNHLKTLISTSVLLEITPEGLQDNRPQKEITDRSIEETCSVYIDIFRRHLLNGNLISRLESRILAIDNAIKSNDFGVDRNLSLTGTQSPMFSEELCQRLRIKKRASSTNDYSPENPFSNKKPKLFGGSLEEYLNATGEQIPCVVSSCIRVLSQHGLHHQGLFRISGSTNEINLMKEAFENGDDPLINVSSPSDMNSVACVLKCYFRELREPLFPVCLFDQFTACAKSIDFVVQILPLMSKLSRGRYLVLRYLFAFLNDLSHYSDENMMDSSNLAICFGPTLLPTPEDKNQVYYQSLVNDLVRNLIEKYDQVFSPDIPGPKYHVFDDGIAFADDGEEPFGTMTTESEFGVNNLFSFTSQLMTNSFHGLPSEHNGLPGRDKRIAAAAAAIVQNRRSMYGDSSNGVMSPIMMSFEDGDERRVLSPKTTKTINSNSIAPISASSSAGRTSLSGESTSSSNNQKENGVVSTNDSPTKKGTIIKSISVLQERVSIDNGSLSTTVNVQPIQDKSPVLPSTSSNSNQSISANSGRIRVPGKMRSTALTAQITYEDKDDSANSTPSHAIFSNGKTTPISSASSSSSPRILSAFSGSTSEEQLLDNSYAVEVNHKSQHV